MASLCCTVIRCFCCCVDDFKPSTVDASCSQSVLPKPRPIKASPSSLDVKVPETSLPRVASMSADDSSAAFRPFRSQLPTTSGEVVSRLLGQVVLPSPSSTPSLQCPSDGRLSTSAITSHNNIEGKSAMTSLSSSNGISAMSAPLVANLMLHPSASSIQLVSTIPAAHLAPGMSRATAPPSVQYIVPSLALSDAGGKIVQMVPTGMPATSQTGTQQLAGFQLAALPRAAIQLGSGPQVLMLCQQSQAQHVQQPQQQLHSSSLSSVVPVMVAAGTSPQLVASK